MKTVFKWRHLWILLLIITVFTIIYFSHQPGEISSAQSTYVRKSISEIIDVSSGVREKIFRIHIRKSAHYFLYAFLGLFTGLFFKTFNKKSFIFLLIGILIFAISDEFHQSFIPGREASIKDVGIDFLGGLTGGIIAVLIAKILSLINKQKPPVHPVN